MLGVHACRRQQIDVQATAAMRCECKHCHRRGVNGCWNQGVNHGVNPAVRLWIVLHAPVTLAAVLCLLTFLHHHHHHHHPSANPHPTHPPPVRQASVQTLALRRGEVGGGGGGGERERELCLFRYGQVAR